MGAAPRDGAALGATAPGVIAAYLYGDALTAPQGHPTAGLPPYAGFEVGYRLVRAYLRRTGRSLAEAMATSPMGILTEAGDGGLSGAAYPSG